MRGRGGEGGGAGERAVDGTRRGESERGVDGATWCPQVLFLNADSSGGGKQSRSDGVCTICAEKRRTAENTRRNGDGVLREDKLGCVLVVGASIGEGLGRGLGRGLVVARRGWSGTAVAHRVAGLSDRVAARRLDV